MRAFEPWHLIVLVVVIGVLFGSRRLPDAARGLGRSMRIFKSEMQQMKDDTPPATKRPASTGPLEGTVVDGQPGSDGQRTPDGRTENRTENRNSSAEARHDV